MFDYLILDIKKNVYGLNLSVSDFKKLTMFQKVWLACFIIAVLGMTISPVDKTRIRLFCYIVAIVLPFVCILHTKYDKYKRLDQLRDRYFERNICRLAVLLKDPKWNLYNEKGIKWIIEQCDRVLEKKSFFSKVNDTAGKIVSLVLPLTLTFLVQIFGTDEIKTFLSTYGVPILYLILICVFLFIGISLIVKGVMTGHKDIYRYVKADMEYLLLRVRV